MDKSVLVEVKKTLRKYFNELLRLVYKAEQSTASTKQLALLTRIRNKIYSTRRFFEDSFTNSPPRNHYDLKVFQHNLLSPLYIVAGLGETLDNTNRQVGHSPDQKETPNTTPHYIHMFHKRLLSLLNFLERDIEEFFVGRFSPNSELIQKGKSLPEIFPGHLQEQHLGKILIVDDNDVSREILSNYLEKQGHTVLNARSGKEMFEYLATEPFDLLLLDIMMPDINGYELLKKLKTESPHRDIPVIMLSGLEDSHSMSFCIELGAEDYLSKSFTSSFICARVESSLCKKELHEREKRYIAALINSQKTIEREINEAAAYIKRMLPGPIPEGSHVSSSWIFIPSQKLGGDFFDYHWINKDLFAFYLLDASGHGIGSALLSVSVANMIRSYTSSTEGITDPGSLLSAINQSFSSFNTDYMFVTLWYGIYEPQKRRLSFSSAGAPPAILLDNSSTSNAPPHLRELQTKGIVLGLSQDAEYVTEECIVPKTSELFLFSDGVYEVENSQGQLLEYKSLKTMLTQLPPKANHPQYIYQSIIDVIETSNLRDDFSFLEFKFP